MTCFCYRRWLKSNPQSLTVSFLFGFPRDQSVSCAELTFSSTLLVYAPLIVWRSDDGGKPNTKKTTGRTYIRQTSPHWDIVWSDRTCIGSESVGLTDSVPQRNTYIPHASWYSFWKTPSKRIWRGQLYILLPLSLSSFPTCYCHNILYRQM